MVQYILCRHVSTILKNIVSMCDGTDDKVNTVATNPVNQDYDYVI